LDYTVVGDTVNIASRLMSSAEGGEILITESTAAEISNKFNTRKLPALRLRGRNEPVRVFHVDWQQETVAKKKRRPLASAVVS
ncbi:MAG TPA: adenylate/guanylate cyclase domain-containing protein, partial [Candidatus Angelobacter sp.]